MEELHPSRKFYESGFMRLVLGIGIPLSAILLAFYLYIEQSFAKCVFYSITGLYCPGCGSGRATVDLLHFHFLEAIHHNILFVIALPFLAYYGVKVYLKIIFGRNILPFFEISPRGGMIIFYVIVVYWILRNVPIFPLNWLAP